MARLLRVTAAAGVALLVAATGAGSRPAAGISITATKPDVALDVIDLPTGIHQYGIAVSARFNPEALHDEVRVTFSDLNGQAAAVPLNFHDSGNVLHSKATYRWFFSVPEGSRILVTTKWRAYTPQPSGTVEGTKTGPIATVIVPKREIKPRFDDAKKQRLRMQSGKLAAACMAFAASGALVVAVPVLSATALALAAVSCAGSLGYAKLASDPVDLSFRSIAKPKPPPAPKVATGEGVSPAAATALNALFAVQVEEIGLMRAMLTAFDRATGAYVKKQPEWERKQMLAAGGYAGRLSALMQSELGLRAKAAAAFDSTLPVSQDAAAAFGNALVGGRLPPQLATGLLKLGLSKADREEVRSSMAVIDPSLYDGDAAAGIADPQLLALLRQVSADMKAFSRRAAKNPLETRPP
jgi:hypothetical protein